MTPKEFAMSTEKTDREANDVEWLAARYVLDELSPADRELFESRMETDEDVCAAVASVTMLFSNLAPILVSERTAVVQPAGGQSGRWSRRRRGTWLLPLSIAGLGLFAIVLSQSLRPTHSPDQAAELLRMWRATDVRVELATEEDAAAFDGEITVPSWLMAAVESDSRRVDGEYDDDEWEDN